jgi:uncharacterized glyoxalase superfamily protein PhnB
LTAEQSASPFQPGLDPILALRPFVPARDSARSRQFYERIGFAATHADDTIVILKQGSFSFILQNYYVAEWADNCMVQMLVRDADAWWSRHIATQDLVLDFGVKPPRPPAIQSWGLKVGFLFDPSGVLWHVGEAPS